MNFQCATPPVNCPGQGNLDYDSPFANLSSEAPDFPITYVGFNWGPIGDPPLGSVFGALGCAFVCLSNISQEAADQCAAEQAALCTWHQWGPVGGGGGGNPGNGGPSIRTFVNSQQQCSARCPDGSLFTWTVLAGTFAALSQAVADAVASSIACQKALHYYFCLGNLTTEACLNQPYTGTVAITGANRGPFTASLVSGSLPPGIFLAQGQRSIQFTGTASAAGNYTFTIRVQDPGGNFIQKTFTLAVLGITNGGNLGNATAGVAYSLQLTASGGTGPYVFSIAGPPSPPLPQGLTINNSGLISGTPTTNGFYTFNLTISDAAGNTCLQPSSLQVGACNAAWSGTGFCPGDPTKTVSASAAANTYCAATIDQANSLAQCAVFNQIQAGLAALGCACYMTVDQPNRLISTTCNMCLQLSGPSGLIPPPNLMCINQANFDPDAWYFALTANHLHGIIIFTPTTFTAPSFRFVYP